MLSVAPGHLIGDKYRVERVLGEGGMGVVVEATHLQLEERVAIKFLLEQHATSAEVVQRFLREARAARMIKSERAVKVFDVGTTASGAPFMVMELLTGSDIAALLAHRGPMHPQLVADLLLQACDALAEAHAKGIVHRDLKPANLFVTTGADGNTLVKVLDFGISKIGSGVDSNLTRTRGFMGTALYVSPEQLRSAKNVDARADIWALGVMLFEMLTRTHPFLADDVAQLSVKIVMDPPTSLRSVRPDLPEELERVVARCLEKTPADRFASCAELAEALAPFASPEGQALAAAIARRAKGVPSTAVAIVPPVAPPPAHQTAAAGSLVKTAEPSFVTPRRAPIIAAIAALLALAIGVVVLVLRSSPPAPSDEVKSAATAAPKASEPTVEAPSTKASEPASTAASAPSVVPSVTAAPTPAPPKAKTTVPIKTKKPKTDDVDI